MAAELTMSSRRGQVAELVLVAAVVGTATLLFWLWSSPRSVDPPPGALSDSEQRFDPRLSIGRVDAPVVIVVASDFQCPYCARFAELTLPELRRTFIDTGRVMLYFRHYPIEGHDLGRMAAELAECADRSGLFWSAHDELFALKAKLSIELIDAISGKIGMEAWRLGRCSHDGVQTAIDADRNWASGVGAFGTPHFLVGRRTKAGGVHFLHSFAGARPIGEFGKLVAALESAAR